MNVTAIRSRIKVGVSRIVLNRLAFSFFLLSFFAGLVQIAIVSISFSNNWNAQNAISDWVNLNGGEMNTTVVAMFDDRDGTAVKLCTQIYDPVNPHPCDAIPVRSSDSTSNSTNQCVQALTYPFQRLSLFKREDVVNVAINAWMLFIATYSVVTESIPHLWAFYVAKVLTSIWSVVLIARSTHVQAQFDAIIYQSPCNMQQSVIGNDYWLNSRIIWICSASINLLSLICSCIYCYKLASRYSSEIYGRVCASPELIAKYKIVLTLNASTQLGLFFFIASGALWLDRLRSGPILSWVRHPVIYQGMFWILVTVVPFWSAMGWYGVRQERKILMAGYLFIEMYFIAAWTAMFDSIIYRWYFLNWAFWAAITTCSVLLLTVIGILIIVCWKNFGNGISHWLYVKSILSDTDFPASHFPASAEGDDAAPNVVHRPSSLYNVPIRRMSTGMSFDTERKWSDPFIGNVCGDLEKGHQPLKVPR